MKTKTEITHRLWQMDDPFGWRAQALIELLPYDHAAQFLDPSVTEEAWDHYLDAGDAMRGYMQFAVDKALDGRELSCQRSLARYGEWVWAFDSPLLTERFEEAPVEPLGAPRLLVVCEVLDLPYQRDLARVIRPTASPQAS